MNNVQNYKEIMAFHPGYYVEEIIETMGISQAEFAMRMGTTGKTLSQLINGQANLSNDLAQKLAIMLGTSVQYWLNLQTAYDQKVIEIRQAKELDLQVEIARQIEYSYFEKYVGLPKAKTFAEKVLNLCGYFKVSDLRVLLQPDFLVNFRAGISTWEEKNMINARAWLQTALNVSASIQTEPFDAEKLKKYLPEIRTMTLQDPAAFLPRLRELFAECGVAFVLLPYLKNSGINGAVKWVNSNRVVLAMNNRRHHADTFWFSLFHEIKHVLQKKITTVFLNADEKEQEAIDNHLEREADSFAQNLLIPERAYHNWQPTKYTTDEEIIDFAEKIGVHPGIVAGRLQHDGIIARTRCADMKQKYEIVV